MLFLTFHLLNNPEIKKKNSFHKNIQQQNPPLRVLWASN